MQLQKQVQVETFDIVETIVSRKEYFHTLRVIVCLFWLKPHSYKLLFELRIISRFDHVRKILNSAAYSSL